MEDLERELLLISKGMNWLLTVYEPIFEEVILSRFWYP